MPYLNSTYDLIFDNTPTVDGVKDLLNLVGLIDALMLGIVFSIITAVDYDGNIHADIRFMTPSDDPERNGYHEFFLSNAQESRIREELGAPSARLALECSYGIAFLFNSLVIILLMYLDVVNKNFEGSTPAKTLKLMHAWWYAGRVLMIFAIGLCYFGCVNSISALVPLVYINFPDYFVEENGELSNQEDAPYGFSQFALNTGWVVLHGTLVFLGLGTASRYWEENKQREQDKAIMAASNILRVSKSRWEKFFKCDPLRHDFFKDVAEEYIDLFVENRLDFSDRATVSDVQLTSMGIVIVGHRVKLMHIFATEKDDDTNDQTLAVPLMPNKAGGVAWTHDADGCQAVVAVKSKPTADTAHRKV